MKNRTTLLTLIVAGLMLVACDKKEDSCGDGTINVSHEQCEPDNLNGETCESLGYYEGTLACGADCMAYDASGCTGRCGDGIIQAGEGENCDGDNLNAQTCSSQGFSQGSGALRCTASCGFDQTSCLQKSTNADLAALTVSSGTLTPAFSAGTTSYTVTVPLAVTTLTVTATKTDTYSSMVIAPTQPMTLNQGNNPVTVTVTAESGGQKVYNVMVTRAMLDYESPRAIEF